ncbi:MAG: dienelactone hydrolase family protein [Cyanobacteria bacterium P01_G01_bin.38]
MLRHPLRSLLSLFALALGLVILLQACTANPPSPEVSSDSYTEKMAQEHKDEKPVASAIANQPAAVEVTSTMVEYATVEGQPVQGFFSKPAAAEGSLPGIIAIHEWWGLNDNIKSVAERLAGEGYSVLAVDLYQGQVADQPDQARQFMQAVMQNAEPANNNLIQAFEYLTEQQQSPLVGSIGWCFGGAWSLNTGLLLPDQLDALAIYYGRLETNPEVLAPLQMPIIGFFGGLDQGIPVEDVTAFETTLNELGKTAEIHIYPEADHAFANPSGERYNPEAAEDAWEKTLAFFAETLKSDT